MDNVRKEELWRRLASISKRVQWMADEEARAAWIGGAAADGRFIDKKLALCDETDRILDELSEGLK